MDLLNIIQSTCMELGLDSPKFVVGNEDRTTVQMLALLNRSGHDLVRNYEWQRLNMEFLLITKGEKIKSGETTIGSNVISKIEDTSDLSKGYGVSGIGIQNFSSVLSVENDSITMSMPAKETKSQMLRFYQFSYPLPEDWNRQVPQTEWSRTNNSPVYGPKSSQEWQAYKSGVGSCSGQSQIFRINNNSIEIYPSENDGMVFSYDYISSYWVKESDTGKKKPYFTKDSDTCVFDDSLMISGLKTRWMQAKGLDYSFNIQEYASLIESCQAQDRSAPKLYMSPKLFMEEVNVQDGSFGKI